MKKALGLFSSPDVLFLRDSHNKRYAGLLREWGDAAWFCDTSIFRM
jgi:hypothetical protein